ncbi:hypothetical protein GQ44DRAFT_69853 [Phaeosphaeriaceae sp. PMI808]|nr:hypothetical protein GQ44DRAFT_69853 [Phaeosphaeriaceae sp. PMI808]
MSEHQHPLPTEAWNHEFRRYLSSPHWDSNHRAYYRKHFSDGAWVFFDWVPREQRMDSGTYDRKEISNLSTTLPQGHDPRLGVAASASSQAAHGSTGREGATILGTYTTANPQNFESLDRAFAVRHGNFFREGIVIAVLFTEAAGNTTRTYNSCISYVQYREQVYTQIRRFVVVGTRRGFCYACNQGTKKSGISPEEHAIVYSEGYSPCLLEGERPLTKRPICVVMTTAEQSRPLTKSSRICFGIHHPIQYNVKVKHIGEVKEKDIPDLLGYWKMENQIANNPVETIAEASNSHSSTLDPHLYHVKRNPSGFDAQLSPYRYHPEHNPYGYHKKNNAHGHHPQENPYMYHPIYNQHGYHEEHNPTGFHPTKNAHSYHPSHNQYGYHAVHAPFCYHSRFNPQGYHSHHNPQGYHPHANRFFYHAQENPYGYNAQINAYGYHDQHNPYGFHPHYNPRGYHPTEQPHAYHPHYHPVVPQQDGSDEDDDSDDDEAPPVIV